MNVAELVAELLVREGVTRVFAVPGGTVLPLMAAIAKRRELSVVVCKDELGAAFMADGYAWASGTLGVVVAIGGPGATNAITGLCCSAMQGNSVLLLSGEVATDVSGKRAAQDGTALSVDVTAISRPATVLSVAITSEKQAVATLQEALRRCLLRSAPAHVSLPLDVQRATVSAEGALHPRPTSVQVRTLSPSGAQEASEILRRPGQRVALLVGRGARAAGPEVLELATRLGAPVATTCGGKGVFPEKHPLSLGVFSFGAGPLAREVLTSGLDVLVAVGTGLGEFATANYCPGLAPRGSLIHVDHDPAVFGRSFAALPVTGDAAQVCRALARELPSRDAGVPSWFAELSGLHHRLARPEQQASDAVPIRPERIMAEIERALPVDGYLVSDIGTSCLFVAHCVRLTPPQRAYIPMVWSCMGHPVAASLGVRLGSGRPTLCVTGDAAFLSKGLELHAAVEQSVGALVWVVLSNGGHGLVKLGTAAILGDDHGVEAGHFNVRPDVAAIARAVGAHAVTVRDPRLLAAALDEAFARGKPAVIDVEVDEHAAPPMADRIQGLAR